MGRRRITQREQLLAAFEKAPGHRLHTFDIRQQMQIGNPSERVRELEDDGYSISHTRTPRNGRMGTLYTFHGARSRAPRPDRPRRRVGGTEAPPSSRAADRAPEWPSFCDTSQDGVIHIDLAAAEQWRHEIQTGQRLRPDIAARVQDGTVVLLVCRVCHEHREQGVEECPNCGEQLIREVILEHPPAEPEAVAA